ncbi:MAG: DUF3108 domain-containing protein [Gemmatimonadales bacterium]
MIAFSRAACLTLCLTPLVTGATEAQTGPDPSRPRIDRFPVGETLLFDVKLAFITLGEGMMHVAGVDSIRGVPSLHVVFWLRGGPPFYKLDDRMDSWFGVDDFRSRRFVQDFHEGGSDRYTHYEIFPDSGFYRQEGIDSALAASPNPLDDTAFFYFVRSLDLEVGDRHMFENYFRPDRNPVIIEVVRRDTLDVPAGRFPSIVIRPTIQGRGILADTQNPRLWLSDDERRLVVQLKSSFPIIGPITLRLKEIGEAPPPEFQLEK